MKSHHIHNGTHNSDDKAKKRNVDTLVPTSDVVSQRMGHSAVPVGLNVVFSAIQITVTITIKTERNLELDIKVSNNIN